MKTLIVLDNLYTGGVASSLYNYLRYVSDRMECTLMVFHEESIDRERLPENVRVIKPPRLLHILGKNRHELARESRFLWLYKAFLTVLCRFANGEFARSFLFCFLPKQTEPFDLAISYSQDDAWRSISKGCNDYVLQKVKAGSKATLIHCDYQNFGGYHPKQQKRFSQFDHIICVSESCRERFAACFPELREQTVACENLTDVARIQKLAENAKAYPKGSMNFVTVSRLGEEKGLERTLRVLRRLRDEGCRRFTWTIVGDGPERERLQTLIEEGGLQEQVVLAGNQKNPYPYLKNASMFILPSFNEAAPMVFGECAALHIPIITTETCSAKEMVADKNWGIVVENSERGLEEGLRAVLNDETDTSVFYHENEEINRNAERQWTAFLGSIKAAANEREGTEQR